jgi:hypothetical protein
MSKILDHFHQNPKKNSRFLTKWQLKYSRFFVMLNKNKYVNFASIEPKQTFLCLCLIDLISLKTQNLLLDCIGFSLQFEINNDYTFYN